MGADVEVRGGGGGTRKVEFSESLHTSTKTARPLTFGTAMHMGA